MKRFITPSIAAGTAVSVLAPLSAFAQTPTIGSGIDNLITLLNGSIVPLIFAIAFIVFLWGVFQYFIAGAGNEEKRVEGRKFAMYGIIGFVLMLSVWGIVNIFYNTLFGGFGAGNRPNLPTFTPGGSGGTGSGGTGGNNSGGSGGSGNGVFNGNAPIGT